MSTSLFIVASFLIANLVLGLWAGRNVKDIRDYAIGNKKWSTGALVMTYLATAFSGSNFFRGTGDYYTMGVCASAACIGVVFSGIIRYWLLASKFKNFSDCSTLGDVAGKLYGDYAKVFTGIVSAIYSLMVVGMQVQILGLVFKNFLQIDDTVSLVISTLFISIYTASGGIKSVVATDILQFVFLLAAIFFVSNIVVSNAGGFKAMIQNVPDGYKSFFNREYYSYIISAILLQAIFAGESMEPAQFQRLLMANNTSQVKKLIMFSLIAWILYSLCRLAIAFSIINLNVDFEGNIILYVFNNFIPEYLKIVVVLGLIAFIMSSGDSFLHSASLSCASDIYQTVTKKEIKNINSIKLLTFIIGTISYFFARFGISFVRLDYVYGVLTPTICIPILFGIYGLNPSKKAFWIASISGLALFFSCKLGLIGDLFKSYSTLIASFANLIIFFIVNIYENKGIIIVNHDQITKSKAIKKNTFAWANLFTRINLQYFKPESNYVTFGILYALILFAPNYVWGSETISSQNLLLIFKGIALIFCSLLISHSIWPKMLKRYLPSFWYLTLTYCLPFLSVIMLILTHGAIEYTINVAINIMFLLLLVDWASAIGVALVGTFAAILYYKIFLQIDPTEVIFGFETIYLLVYQVIFGSVIGLLFARKKDIKLYGLENQISFINKFKKSILASSQHSAKIIEDSNRSHFGVKLDPQKALDNIRRHLVEKNLASDEISCELRELETFIAAEAISISPYLVLDVQEIELSILATECVKFCNSIGFENVSLSINSKKQKIQCDSVATLKVLAKIIEEFYKKAKENNEENDVYMNITFADTVIKYLDNKGSFIRGEEAINIIVSDSEKVDKYLNENFWEKSLIDPKSIPQTLIENSEMLDIEHTVDAHYGVLRNMNDDDNIIWTCVLPVKVYDIRPITLDLAAPTKFDLSYQWPAAEDLEKKFITKLEESGININKQKLNRALEIIKIYHRHQTRKSGEPYYMHPINVGLISIDIINDKAANIHDLLLKKCDIVIFVSLLHDILEDTYYKPKNIINDFSQEVLECVEAVTKTNYAARQYLVANKSAFEELIAKDPITIVVKIADRMHNLLTIDGHSKREKRIAIAQESLEFFVEPAKKLGLLNIADRLESASRYIIKNGTIEGFSNS